jgi:hypothetical protein
MGLPLNTWALRYGRGEDHPEATVVSAVQALPPPKSDQSVYILAFMLTTSGMVGIGMATNLPHLFAAIGAAPAAAIAAASLVGPAQVAARVFEFSARRRINPLVSARIASVLHPLASLIIAIGGAPSSPHFQFFTARATAC